MPERSSFPRGVQDAFALVDAAPDAMIIVGRDGRVAFANAQVQRIFGYGRDELRGEAIERLVPARFRAVHVDHRSEYAVEPRVRAMGAGLELFGLRADGTEFPVEISLSPVEIEGEPFTVCAIRDISDRKAVERLLQRQNEELESANRSKDRFLASMSHELRTPLNAIIGFTGTLLMRLPGPLTNDQEQQLKIVQSSARHLLSLINDILDLTKVESGKVELSFEPVDPASVVAEVTDSLRSMAKDKGLTLEVAPAPPVAVVTDRRALQQILVNLVNNAIKYTDRGSVIVTVAPTVDTGVESVAFEVADTGVGIREEDKERLFQAFEQLDPSSTRRFEGVGLGLYLSEKLALLLGGTLGFRSEYGAGSTFTLTLPRDRRT